MHGQHHSSKPGSQKWQDKEHHRRAHTKHPSVAGEAGHWVRTAGVLAPLIIGEFVKDPERKWRFVRITSIAAAVLSEGLHAHKSYRERERDREALQACASGAALTPVS
jgi:hypothetical protein